MSASRTRFFFRLRPLGPIRAGGAHRLERNDTTVRSDTLFSALYACSVAHGIDPAPAFGELPGAPRARVSSVFPVIGEAPLLPRPALPPADPEGVDEGRTELRLRRVRWVSPRVLHAWLRGDRLPPGPGRPPEGTMLANDDAPAHVPEWVFRAAPQSGAAIDRTRDYAAPFQRDLLHVNAAEGVGMGFFLDAPDSDLSRWRELTERLGETGLGGKRSTGSGAFAIEGIGTAPPGLDEGAGGHVYNLSLLSPTPEEVRAGLLEGDSTAYGLIRRGGWVTSAAGAGRRRRLRMIEEGATFVRREPPVEGRVLDLAPTGMPHPVYRSGLAFPIRFRRGGA